MGDDAVNKWVKYFLKILLITVIVLIVSYFVYVFKTV